MALSVVTEDDFRTYHYATVEEALRNLPGVEIRRSGSLGKTCLDLDRSTLRLAVVRRGRDERLVGIALAQARC